MSTVIHRDRTFTAGGQTYVAIYGGPGWGYEIVTYPELRHVADGFFTLAEVRAYADEALASRRAGSPGRSAR
jgi:hypothetical protein